ncbi:unnamed protein product [Rhizophagus irregularis]|nr:unnamed protein product [Rhizophagus irregularis]
MGLSDNNHWKRILASIDFNNVNYPLLADIILAILLPSIHTTSSGCANVVMDLASRPQYMQELYEEQLRMMSWKTFAINEIKYIMHIVILKCNIRTEVVKWKKERVQQQYQVLVELF